MTRLVLALVLLAGCAPERSVSGRDPHASPGEPAPDTSRQPPFSAPTPPIGPSAFDEPPSHPLCVPAYRALGGTLGREPLGGVKEALLAGAPQQTVPIDGGAAARASRTTPGGGPTAVATPLTWAELRTRVIEATGFWPLRGPATWAAGPPQDRGGLELREIVASDRRLGRWPAARLSPRGAGPHAAVLLLHGHGDTVEDALTQRFGDALAAAGFVALAPSIRAYWDGACEEEAAWALLEAGSTLMGVHLAEAARAVRHLREDPDVDPARIYVVGHSGGGGIARLVPFVGPVAGVVTDGPQAFGQLPEDRSIGDDFVPALRDLGGALGREDSLGVPSAYHPIGPGGDPAEVVRLLRSWGSDEPPRDR